MDKKPKGGHLKITKKIAVYLGSFDPITLGHLDVIERTANIFDELIIGIGKHNNKSFCFSSEERLQMIMKSCEKFKNVTAKTFEGLAVDFCIKNKATVIVRGLRTEADYVYEMQMAMINKTLSNHLDTIFIPTRQKLCHISSSLVKEVAGLNGNVEQFVPPLVAKKLYEKFKTKEKRLDD